jgi:hypothetical protein
LVKCKKLPVPVKMLIPGHYSTGTGTGTVYQRNKPTSNGMTAAKGIFRKFRKKYNAKCQLKLFSFLGVLQSKAFALVLQA